MLAEWRLALEGKGSRISRNKTERIVEYGRSEEGTKRSTGRGERSDATGGVESFKYYGSFVRTTGLWRGRKTRDRVRSDETERSAGRFARDTRESRCARVVQN